MSGAAGIPAVHGGEEVKEIATPPTSPPGPSMLRLRTAKRAAGSLMPLEGKALAVVPNDGETGPDEGGTNAPAITGVEDTREGWRPRTTTWVA